MRRRNGASAAPVELFHQCHEVFFRFAHIGSGQAYQVVAACKRLETLEDLAEEEIESGKIVGRAIADGISVWKPERIDLCSIDALPVKL